MRIGYLPESVTVAVGDNGPGPAADGSRTGRQRAGYGLAGMRERAAPHGGSLLAGPRAQGGFRVAVSLPAGPGEGRTALEDPVG